ncbi:MAG TPA: hypothetical protein VFZ65_19455 [Planctomycetota bacterium]|nr:hypothetical protein [Planctomycetota bacterium]
MTRDRGLAAAVAAALAVANGAVAAEPPPRGRGVGPCFHAVAFVNDPLSHGAVGDGLLSLNEAILLHNGQLTLAQLSAAEQVQLSLIPGTGSTTDVTWIDIDASNTPVITIEQDLAPVLDTSFGLLIKGFGGAPVFDFSGANLGHGLRVPANSCSLQDLVFSGGPYGIDVTQTDVAGQAGLTLTNVRFENCAQFGVRVGASTANGIGRVILDRCDFAGCATAITCSETGPGRTTIFEAHEVAVTGATNGIEFVLGPGGTARYTFDRVTIAAAASGLRLQRPALADRSVFVEGSFVRVRAAQCVAIDCVPNNLTWAVLRLWDLRAAPGGTALALGDVGDALFGDLDELTLHGDVRVRAGGAGLPLVVHNARCRGGAVLFATSAGQPFEVLDSRFDLCAVASQGTGPVVCSGSCFAGGSLTGTAAAPISANGCHVQVAGAFVQQTQSLPAEQLGSMSVAPDDVPVGSTITFQADLPAGLVGFFALGYTAPMPIVAAPPFHVYFDPAVFVFAPGAYRFQQGFGWLVPNSPQFRGLDFVVHLVVLPDPGVQAPWLQLPPPARFVLL